ncbi:MAG: pyruvate carboxyltransferase [Desulfobulbaceae bacterium]|uniref:Pyruvate carboxyltransferase n=1 Tax=Candidatus Desulfobia pelagia TaxID=2841692 RepID=A0A8J6NG23_9BACT|nr:pyruvate carboxyltransferase [Candidatus Desulfobia pelagia]
MKGLIDSTLREGSQTVGVSFSLEEKKQILTGLFQVGIEEVEIGVATSLDQDLSELIRFAGERGGSNRISLWCRCRNNDIDYAASLHPDVLSLSIPGSDLHIQKKLGWDRRRVLDTIGRSVARACSHDFKMVSLGIEDATRTDMCFLEEMVQKAVKAGVQRIRLADTVGIVSPGELAETVRKLKAQFAVDIGVHCHNDFGMATANSVTAIDAGADWADVTVLGLGERTGNAKLEEVAGYLAIRRDRVYNVEFLLPLAELIARVGSREIASYHPLLGSRIFHCETGLHLQGLERDSRTYEPYPPERVGASRKLFFGSKIGRQQVKDCLSYLGVYGPKSLQDRVLNEVRKRSVDLGRPFVHTELISMVSQVDR